jgi:oligopeptide transport system permease protein
MILNKELFQFSKEKPTKKIETIEKSIVRKRFIVGVTVFFLLLLLSHYPMLSNNEKWDQSVLPNKSQSVKLPPKIIGFENLGLFNGKLRTFVLESEINEPYVLLLDNQPNEENSLYYAEVDVYLKKGVEGSYVFGTDDLGRDMFIRVLKGLQISLTIGIGATLIDLVIGIILGGISGMYSNKKPDVIIMRVIEVLNGIPTLAVLLLMFLVIEPGILSLVIALSLTGWTTMARLVRSQVIKLKKEEYILSSRAIGLSDLTIFMKHILPNAFPQIIALVAVSVPNAIFYESFLAFLGLGLTNIPSLGTLIASGYKYMNIYPYLMWIPTITLGIVMLDFNVLSNELATYFDPKQR